MTLKIIKVGRWKYAILPRKFSNQDMPTILRGTFDSKEEAQNRIRLYKS